MLRSIARRFPREKTPLLTNPRQSSVPLRMVESEHSSSLLVGSSCSRKLAYAARIVAPLQSNTPSTNNGGSTEYVLPGSKTTVPRCRNAPCNCSLVAATTADSVAAGWPLATDELKPTRRTACCGGRTSLLLS